MGLIALFVITIVLLVQSSPSSSVSGTTHKFALKTHFVDSMQFAAYESPESARLGPRVTTYTEVPNLNENVSQIFDQGSLGSCVANALVSAFD